MALGECSVGGKGRTNDLSPDQKQRPEREAESRDSTMSCRCSSSLSYRLIYSFFFYYPHLERVCRDDETLGSEWCGRHGNVAMHAEIRFPFYSPFACVRIFKEISKLVCIYVSMYLCNMSASVNLANELILCLIKNDSPYVWVACVCDFTFSCIGLKGRLGEWGQRC